MPVRAYDNNVSHIEFKEGPEWDRDYQGIKTHAHSAIQKSNAKTRKVQACGYVMCNFHEAIAAITAKKKGRGEKRNLQARESVAVVATAVRENTAILGISEARKQRYKGSASEG